MSLVEMSIVLPYNNILVVLHTHLVDWQLESLFPMSASETVRRDNIAQPAPSLRTSSIGNHFFSGRSRKMFERIPGHRERERFRRLGKVGKSPGRALLPLPVRRS